MHQYFGIDLRQVWETAELDMPILKAKVREILQEIDDKLATLSGIPARVLVAFVSACGLGRPGLLRCRPGGREAGRASANMWQFPERAVFSGVVLGRQCIRFVINISL